MKRFVVRYPLLFAVAATLAGVLSLCWTFWVPGWSTTTQVLAGRVTICLLAVGLLTQLSWWREAGFVRPAGWRVLVPFLPLLLPMLLNVLGLVATGGQAYTWGMIITGLVTYGLGGFMEEALFRGLVLRALRPGGILRAAVLMSLIFGPLHAVNWLMGADPSSTAFQVVMATLVGFAYVGPLAYTGNIWPLVVTHAATNFVDYLIAGGFVNTTATSAAPAPIAWAAALIVIVPIAAYSLWLIRRMGRQTREEPLVEAQQREPGVTGSAGRAGVA